MTVTATVAPLITSRSSRGAWAISAHAVEDLLPAAVHALGVFRIDQPDRAVRERQASLPVRLDQPVLARARMADRT
jgi:hypothetical protein